MKNRLRFLNPIASAFATLMFFAVDVTLAVALIINAILENVSQILIFGILLILLLPAGVVTLRVACWRFYRIAETNIESGGFLRRKRRVYLPDIVAIRKENIIIFHGTKNVLEEIYMLSTEKDYVIIEINKESDALVEEIGKKNNLV